MSNWSDIIAAHTTGTLSYTFTPSINATIKCYARLLSDDYTGQAIYRLSDEAGTHYVQLEGQTSNTMKLVEYPGASVLITDIPVLHNTWQMLVLVVTLTQVHIYQNGVLINSGFLANPLQVASMLFYNTTSQLYDELVHIPSVVSTEQIERWQEQEWPMVTADPGGSYEEQYALGTLAEPTGTWSSSPPVVDNGEYLWMRKRWVEGDGTPGDWSTPVRIKGDMGDQGPQGLQGLQGPKGDKGIQGPKGADGLDSYTHIAYATGASGQNFSVSHFPTATYIGMYVDHTEADSTTWSDYNWTLIKGADGAQGIPGVKGDDGLTAYFHTAWANNDTGTSGFSTTVSAGKLYIGTYTDHTEADSSDPTKYKWVKIKGETGSQGPKGDTGPQGPAGTPGFLGLYVNGETLHLKGYGADGVLDQSVGYIYAGGERIAVPATSLTLTEEGIGYILFNNTWIDKVVFAKMKPKSNSVDWVAYNNPSATAYSTTNTYVIGKFQKDNTVIHDEVIISPIGCKDYTTAHFMEIIATEDWGSFQTWAEALNVTQTFERLAAYEAFIGKLFANQIKLSEGGAIYSGYSADGNTPPLSGSGFWLGANGKLKAQWAELLGTLRTGYNAPTDARVSIQDEIGITSGPTFTGTGLNDLTITEEGNVAGDFRVKISGINNATNSGKEGYWATPFQVGTHYRYAVAVNSAGRFVAVGASGYISYSDDGITWATPFTVGNRLWYGIAVNSSGRFVAVGEAGYISYSDDGITWATPFKVGTSLWRGIAVNSAGKFVAVGEAGYISYSDDGITWVTPFTVGNRLWRGIAVNSSGRFVAVGYNGHISYSNDGINWVTPFQVGTSFWYGIAVNSSGRFVAVGNFGYISYSNDGITWATPFRVGTSIWYGIAVNSSGRFVAVGGNGYISYSDDGITWVTPFKVGTYYWRAIAVNSSGRFVAVGDYGHITMSLLQDSIKISSNGGTTWGSDTIIPLDGAISITGFGIDILFGHVEGHTLGDYWSFKQEAMRGLAITDSAGVEYFSASDGVVNIAQEVGHVAFFARSSPPSGWLKCNGAAISRTSYSKLYSVIGTTFGAGNGSTTFNLPDLRGEFLRGWDNGRGADTGRTFGTSQSWAIQNITGNTGNVLFDDGYEGTQYQNGALYRTAGTRTRSWSGTDGDAMKNLYFDASRSVQTSTETRPRNVALLACIKY